MGDIPSSIPLAGCFGSSRVAIAQSCSFVCLWPFCGLNAALPNPESTDSRKRMKWAGFQCFKVFSVVVKHEGQDETKRWWRLQVPSILHEIPLRPATVLSSCCWVQNRVCSATACYAVCGVYGSESSISEQLTDIWLLPTSNYFIVKGHSPFPCSRSLQYVEAIHVITPDLSWILFFGWPTKSHLHALWPDWWCLSINELVSWGYSLPGKIRVVNSNTHQVIMNGKRDGKIGWGWQKVIDETLQSHFERNCLISSCSTETTLTDFFARVGL